MHIVRFQRWLWLPVAVLAALAAWQPSSSPILPVLPRATTAHGLTPMLQEVLLPSTTPAVHSSALVELPQGDRLMFWFGGRREGATDVAVWQSHYHAGEWSAPRALVRPKSVGSDEWRYVKKVGNPLAVRLANGDIQLFFVSVSMGGWAGSSLNLIRSSDGGQTWSGAQKLVTSPFLNISTLARTRAVPLADGGFYLPVYHEFLRKFPELLRFDRTGQLVDKTRMSAQHQLLQPALAQTGEQQLVSLLRDGKGQYTYWQQSRNAGLSWSAPQPVPLVNHDSSLAVARLPDGRVLAVYNDGEHMREQLALAVSRDMRNWRHLGWLESRPGSDEEYSYPAILVDGDIVDISYTWQRKQIKHVRFNLAWLDDPKRLQP